MVAIFLFAAVFGWLFVALFLFSGSDFDSDVGVDADLDLDADADLDVDSSSGFGGLAGLIGALLSFRSIVFFAAFFGLAGLLLTWLGTSTVLATIVGAGVGLFAAVANVQLMDYLKRTSVSSRLTDRRIAGNPAKVVLPIGPGHRGKVAVDVAGQPIYLVALPFNDRHEKEYAVGDTVVIVEVRDGSALVTAMDELD